jgi:hypothetical protein
MTPLGLLQDRLVTRDLITSQDCCPQVDYQLQSSPSATLNSITGIGSALGAGLRDRSRSRLELKGQCRVTASIYTYVSSNGAAGDWYWEVTNRGEIITRGLVATGASAPADALTAALSDVDPRPENLPPYLEDPSPSLAPLWGSLGGRMADAAAKRRRDNRLLAALPPETLALLDRDLRQVSLQQGAIPITSAISSASVGTGRSLLRNFGRVTAQRHRLAVQN